MGVIKAMHVRGNNMESKTIQMPANAPQEARFGRTNYVGVAGCLGANAPRNSGTLNDDYGRYEGVLFNRSRITLNEITAADGTSNTLMYGEGLGGRVTDKGRDLAWSWMGVGAMWTYYGLTPDVPDDNPATGQYRFGSRHKDGVNFAFADASVRGVRWGKTAVVPKAGKEPTDWTLLQQLAGRRDGLNFDVKALLE